MISCLPFCLKKKLKEGREKKRRRKALISKMIAQVYKQKRRFVSDLPALYLFRSLRILPPLEASSCLIGHADLEISTKGERAREVDEM